MRAYYDERPAVLGAVGNGSFLYRYDIEEVAAPAMGDGEEARTQWTCEEVTVWSPVTANKITEAVIVDRWEASYEQKLVNEYNAAQLGLYGADEATEKEERYKTFLAQRAALKARVDADCATLNIR